MFNGEIEDVIFAYLKGLDTPRSLRVWLTYKYGDFHELVSIALPDPLDYVDVYSFQADYQATLLLRKSEFLDTGIDRKRIAAQKLAVSEHQCQLTNERIRSLVRGEIPSALDLYFRIKRKIARILGPFDLDEFAESQGWGPGATYSLKRKSATLVDKLLEKQVSVTAMALSVARTFGRDIHWARARGIDAEGPISLLNSEFNIVPGCRGTFVPKDARSDRFIAIEPTANLFLQKGIGKMIRNRLRRFGIDLNDQTKNQRLALSGSLTGDLATLDLSSASDSVSRELVAALLPDDWYLWLNRLRSHSLVLDGETRYLQKFSSMGNGFTFELESLIFYAIASEISSGASVYGDDIVVKSDRAPEVVKALEFFGFTVNTEKSFSLGLFRESCGSHYFKGHDVKPIYIKADPYGSVTEFIVFCNNLLLSAWRFGTDGDFHPHLFKAWQRAVRDYTGPWVSVFNGDSTLNCGVAYPVDHAVIERNRTTSRRGYFGIVLPGLSLRPGVFKHPWLDATLAYTLRFAPQEPLSRGIPVERGGVYVTRRILHWHDGRHPR